jgi:hypothetical protein
VALNYWAGVPGPIGKLHIKNLTVALSGLSAAAWSPDQHANCGADWLVFNGANEGQPVAQANLMTGALHSAGCSVVEDVFPDTAHGFDYWQVVLPQVVAEAQS